MFSLIEPFQGVNLPTHVVRNRRALGAFNRRCGLPTVPILPTQGPSKSGEIGKGSKFGRCALCQDPDAPSILQRLFDGQFGISYGVSTCKCDASPHSGSIEKNNPFPATWICRLNYLKLHSFVFHSRPSKFETVRPAIRSHVEARPRCSPPRSLRARLASNPDAPSP